MGNHANFHFDIPAKDPESAAKFYADLFGWERRYNQTLQYWMFRTEPERGGGFVSTEVGENPAKVGEIAIYIETDDIDATLTKAQEQGGKIVVPKRELTGVGWEAVFTDPTGNKVGLFQVQQNS